MTFCSITPSNVPFIKCLIHEILFDPLSTRCSVTLISCIFGNTHYEPNTYRALIN